MTEDQSPKPPGWMVAILQLFIHRDYLEEIEGDMEELFSENIENYGFRKARKKYLKDVLKLIRPNLLGQIKWFQQLILTTMIRNNFKMAIRNLLKTRTNSLINLKGLSIGLAIGATALLYVTKELSFDNFHENGDRLFKVVTKTETGEYMETNSWPVGHKLRTEYPEVESVVYTRRAHPSLKVNDKDQKFAHTIHYASGDFFTMFSFPFVEGNPETALSSPNAIVITEAMKDRYFEGAALGETLTLRDTINYQVTGVVENVPDNSHIRFDMLISFKTYENDHYFSYVDGWGNFNVRNYVLLKKGADATSLRRKAKTLYTENIGSWMDDMGVSFSVALVPMKEIYLQSGIYNGFGPMGSLESVRTIALIAIFALLLAVINYINLNTARSVYRAREVGVRKVNGSTRGMLIAQFLTESFLITLIASFAAILLLYFGLPFFNQLMDKQFELGDLMKPWILAGLFGLILLISFLSGYYPALVLSGLKPVQALKAKMSASGRGLTLRKSLIVFQFFISAGMVLSTLIVINQIDYMRNQHLGFEKEQILVLDATNLPGGAARANLKSMLSSLPEVQTVSHTNALPAHPGWQGQWAYPGKINDDPVDTEYMAIDENYIAVLGLELVAGNNFDISVQSALADGLVINESCVYAMGWANPAEAIGKKIVSPSETPAGTVIGVVKDYHGLGLQNEIWPKAMDYSSDRYGRYYAIKFTTSNTASLLEKTEKLYNELYGNYSFEYFFLDEAFDRQYKQEEQLANVLMVFATIILIVSGIGLFGLIAFVAASKTKEVGIRKTLGASAWQIILLFAKDFITLVLVGNLLVIPFILYFGQDWLSNFAYRTEISPAIFVWSLLITSLFSLLMICFKTIKTARMNPVESLRYE
ncbi:MAG: ABC transporter permease [Cyclobacteriaceae bacterium]